MRHEQLEERVLLAGDPGIFILPSSGIVTAEGGGEGSLEISIQTAPTADVTIGLASSDTTEGTVSPSSVTFTPANWETSQTVTAVGVDDAKADGNIDYQILTAPAVSSDPDYSGRNAADAFVTNIDDDSAGVTVQPTTGQTTEGGGTATFQIVLDSEPTGDVTITLTSSDTNEGTIAPGSVTFTSAAWNSPQTITVIGQDDSIADGNTSYSIVTSSAVSSDVSYSGRSVVDVSMTNLDDDSVGIMVEPTTGETDESGATATFSITLSSQPTADVTINLSSSDTSEGIVSVSSVTFTPAIWNTPHQVTVTGQDDVEADGNVAYSIITAPAVSSDVDYSGRNAADVSIINRDNDSVGISVQPTTVETNESGGDATFSIVLSSQPTSSVLISLTSSDSSEGTVSPAQVSFTPEQWDVPQTATVTGQDDQFTDGSVVYTVVTAPAVSADPNYNNRDAADVTVTNLDNDTANLIVSPTSGLETNEDGGVASFSVVLTSQPTSNVVVQSSSSNLQEGTTSPELITFTTSSWDQPQSVSVQGVDDSVIDGDIIYQVSVQVSSTDDPTYAAIDPAVVTVVNHDNDLAGLNIIGGDDVATSEIGDSSTFFVALTVQPTSDVAVQVASSDETEGTSAIDLLTFTPASWDTPQEVTVTGIDDAFVDGDLAYSIVLTTASADATFDDLEPVPVSVINHDDDFATLTLSTVDSEIVEGTGEVNPHVTFQIELTGDVDGGFSLAHSTDDGTASATDGDYIDNDDVIAFLGADGEVHSVDVQVVADNILEPNELFTAALGLISDISPSAALRIGTEGSPLEFTIVDDEELTISFFGVSLEEGTGDTPSSFQFNIELSNPVQGGLHIPYTTDDDSATLGDNDYIDNDGTLEMTGALDEAHVIEVFVPADSSVERDEAFIVTLQEIIFLDPALADSVEADGGAQVGTILNDDLATIAFVEDASLAIETALTHSIQAQLSVTNGGTLSEDVTFEFGIVPGGTALIPDDILLVSDATVTFPAGSFDGDVLSLDMQLVWNDGPEDDEFITFDLVLVSGDMDGQVVIGEPDQHEMTLSEDTFAAKVSGHVWFDANNNGLREEGEISIPGAVVMLAGVDISGLTVEITRMTDDAGEYLFERLAAGTYEITESQPAAFTDGLDVLGNVDGVPAGEMNDDHFSNIVLAPSQNARDYDFGEQRLTYLPMSRRLFFASTPPLDPAIRDVVADGEEIAGNSALAETVRRAESIELRRIRNVVKLTGTSQDDQFLFVPAASATSTSQTEHLISVNGLEWYLDADEINWIVFDGQQGDNEAELRDSPDDDLLAASHDSAILSSTDYRVDAIAFDLVRAISSSGGQDEVTEDDVHFTLELEGPWIRTVTPEL